MPILSRHYYFVHSPDYPKTAQVFEFLAFFDLHWLIQLNDKQTSVFRI